MLTRTSTGATPNTQICRVSRGGEHHQVLDSYEGVAADSTVATQLGQITGEIAEHKDQAGYAGTAAKLRVAASVFGA
jgi:hypothetical protein